MPCRCDGYEDDTRAQLDKLTRVCCDMRTVLRNHRLERELCAETLSWIAKHDEEDAKRIAEEQRRNEREKAKQAALDKLTMDERRMLGL